jgi:hypothetical protein
MKEYKVLKEVRYQNHSGLIKFFGIGEKISQKDLKKNTSKY